MPTNDYRSYTTVREPHRFPFDFLSFYEWGHRRMLEVRSDVRHVLDLAYGDDPKQKLDIYLPSGELRDSPVLIYMHGGGFFEGDRVDYAFLASAVVERGIILVLPSYRLCSDGNSILDAVSDTRAVVNWVYRHIADHGGNAGSIILSGHSAGAIMAANIVTDLAWMDEFDIPQSALKAAVLVSGIYDFPVDYNSRNEIFTSAEVKHAMSAVRNIGSLLEKILLAAGSVETGPRDDYVASAHMFRDALTSAGGDVDLMILPDKNHIETSRVVGEADSPVFQAIVDLLRV